LAPSAGTTMTSGRDKADAVGSVRVRANKYNLIWDDADPSCGLQNAEHREGAGQDV
jgi:hypothetical protein